MTTVQLKISHEYFHFLFLASSYFLSDCVFWHFIINLNTCVCQIQWERESDRMRESERVFVKAHMCKTVIEIVRLRESHKFVKRESNKKFKRKRWLRLTFQHNWLMDLIVWTTMADCVGNLLKMFAK